MVSKEKVKKKNIFFFTFLNWEKQTWYGGKRWLFPIGNGARNLAPRKGQKIPLISYCVKSVVDKMFEIFTHSNLSHQFILVSVHPCQLSHVGKHIL